MVSNDTNTHDSYVWQTNPNSNYGDLDYIRFGKKSGGEMVGFHRFSYLPTLPYGADMTEAKLKFTFRPGQTTGANGICNVVTSNQWYETSSGNNIGITWNNKPWRSVGYSSSHHNFQYYEFNIRPFVEGWYNGSYINYGVGFTYDNMIDDYNSVVSSEGDAENTPTLTIKYTVPPTHIVLSQTAITADIGTTHQLSAVVLPNYASDQSVVWDSNNKSIATVSSSGLVRLIQAGTAVISATTVNGISATCTISAEELLFTQFQEKRVSYLALDGDGPGAVAFPIFHTVTFNTYVNVDRQTDTGSRRISEVEGFAKIDRVSVTYIGEPEVSIGLTEINGTEITMAYDPDVWTTPSWIWDRKTAHPNIYVGSIATFESRAVCWQEGTIYPYQDVYSKIDF